MESGEYNIKIDRSKDPVMDWQEWARKILWYGHRSGDYLYKTTPLQKNIAGRH